jgi:hypothetical protein
MLLKQAQSTQRFNTPGYLRGVRKFAGGEGVLCNSSSNICSMCGF